MKIIVTGAAGFIGFHISRHLLKQGYKVIGIDNVNNYYDPKHKTARLDILNFHENFKFYQSDIENKEKIAEIFEKHIDTEFVVHFAAQAGVRYSTENPYKYIDSNITGMVTILENTVKLPHLRHFFYASSSSVYGENELPFSEKQQINSPVSIYAATKVAGEAIAHSYHSLYNIKVTGFRFFTVYGPFGRPDMAYYLFTDAIAKGEPIKLFNNGNMMRDFTYIDDIIAGVASSIEKSQQNKKLAPAYNLGNNKVEPLMKMVNIIEENLGKKAIIEFAEFQKGDVEATFADIGSAAQDLDFVPKVGLEEGVRRFVEHYLDG